MVPAGTQTVPATQASLARRLVEGLRDFSRESRESAPCHRDVVGVGGGRRSERIGRGPEFTIELEPWILGSRGGTDGSSFRALVEFRCVFVGSGKTAHASAVVLLDDFPARTQGARPLVFPLRIRRA